MPARLLAIALSAAIAFAQQPGKAAYDAFLRWRAAAGPDAAAWDRAIARYRDKLKSDGLDEAAARRAIEAIEAYDEGAFYDGIYAAPAKFNTAPNRLLVAAVKGRPPGAALDVAMGQGRNALYLAALGWRVTGFDVSAGGLRAAEREAKSRGLSLETVHASDQDFDFGEARWDLIALIYPIEKRSVHRVRSALKPGGLVVIEAGHKSASNAPFEYDTGELPRIFDGFRILRYEETVDVADWSRERIRLVRLIAEKLR